MNSSKWFAQKRRSSLNHSDHLGHVSKILAFQAPRDAKTVSKYRSDSNLFHGARAQSSLFDGGGALPDTPRYEGPISKSNSYETRDLDRRASYEASSLRTYVGSPLLRASARRSSLVVFDSSPTVVLETTFQRRRSLCALSPVLASTPVEDSGHKRESFFRSPTLSPCVEVEPKERQFLFSSYEDDCTSSPGTPRFETTCNEDASCHSQSRQPTLQELATPLASNNRGNHVSGSAQNLAVQTLGVAGRRRSIPAILVTSASPDINPRSEVHEGFSAWLVEHVRDLPKISGFFHPADDARSPKFTGSAESQENIQPQNNYNEDVNLHWQRNYGEDFNVQKQRSNNEDADLCWHRKKYGDNNLQCQNNHSAHNPKWRRNDLKNSDLTFDRKKCEGTNFQRHKNEHARFVRSRELGPLCANPRSLLVERHQNSADFYAPNGRRPRRVSLQLQEESSVKSSRKFSMNLPKLEVPPLHLTSPSSGELPPLGTVLGKGGFGTVILARFRGEPVAVKRIYNAKTEACRDSERAALDIKTHPHLVTTLALVSAGRRPGRVKVEQRQHRQINEFELSWESMARGMGWQEKSDATPLLDLSDDSQALSIRRRSSISRNLKLFTSSWLVEQSSSWLWVVSELCSNSTLHSVLHSTLDLTIKQKLRFLGELASGLAFLHEEGFVHRDVKPANAFLSWQGTVKLGDFGCCGNLGRNLKPVVGTIPYQAPEILQGAAGSTKSDVFSLGVTMWHVLHRAVPYLGLHPHVVAYNVTRVGMRPDSCSLATQNGSATAGDMDLLETMLATLARKCWKQHPEDRISTASVCRSIAILYLTP